MLDRPLDRTFEQPRAESPPAAAGAHALAMRYFSLGWRSRYLFCAVALGILVFGTLAVLSLKRSFMAPATVVVTTRVVDPMAQSPDANRSIEDDEPATQAALIQSRDVAALVLKELPPPSQKPSRNWHHFLCEHGVRLGCGAGTEVASNSAGVLDRQIDALLSSVTVEPQARSRIMTVSAKADTGERAAAVANAFVTNYQKLALTQQSGDLQREAEWLDDRTAALRQRWLEAERAASAYNVQHELVNTTGGSPLVEHQISDMAVSLGQAQTRYAAAQAKAATLKTAMQTGDPQTLLSLTEQPLVVAAATALMQGENQKAQKSASFGPNHPDVIAFDRQIASSRANLNAATRQALLSINGALMSARADVEQLTSALDRLRVQSGRQSGAQAEYRTLDQESQSARGVYEAFLDRAKQLTDRVALLQPPIMFVSHAAVPATATFPNRKKLMMGVIVLAIAGGVGAVALRVLFSSGFTDLDEFRGFGGIPLLAVFPRIQPGKRKSPTDLMRDHAFSLPAEAVRQLGAQLSMAQGMSGSGGARVIAITSALPGDGKMTLASWLAAAAEEAGETALVIDTDFSRRVGLDSSRVGGALGLSDVLQGKAAARNVISRDQVRGCDVMAAGTPRGYVFDRAEITQLQDLFRDLSRSYRVIILVTPPLGVTAGGLSMASVADQTLFVCRWGRASRETTAACVERLRLYGVRLSGFVVTGTDNGSFNLLCGAQLTRQEARLIAHRRQA
ncbi:MAG: polysaccharide biosynthesis tyrosine autokinase [Acetobacter aceti]|nr:polysaccharide biosynthesis tyrosine autokinase [Acetobacter aceti]